MPRLKPQNLKNLNILMADADPFMIGLSSAMLENMGFGNIRQAKNSQEALKYLSSKPTDILITEWQLQPMNGIEFSGALRKGPDSPRRTLPIIMLTARAEKKDVEQARDAGITEFVGKPYAAQTLFKSIQQVVDYPRPFIAADNYAGPDRRRRQQEIGDIADRRRIQPQAAKEKDLLSAPGYCGPRILAPDFTIKQKIGLTGTLDSIITPKLLLNAQQAIDAAQDQARPWIARDIQDLENDYDTLCKTPTLLVVENIKNAALSVKARAGAVRDEVTSGVAQLTYLFMRNQYAMGNKFHNLVLLKHVQSLQVVFGGNFAHMNLGHELIHELHLLASMVM